jgi:predicted O-methyltransferase YrrM
MVFCDADPLDYPDYLTAALRLLRPGGVVAFNNAVPVRDGSEVTGGAAADDAAFGDIAAADATDVAEQVRGDERLVPLLVPLGNGLLAAVKKGE